MVTLPGCPAAVDRTSVLSSIVALISIVLCSISMSGSDWVRGTSMDRGQPKLTLVSLGGVTFATEVETSKGRKLRFTDYHGFKELCKDPRIWPRDYEPTHDTDQSIWCAALRLEATSSYLATAQNSVP